MYGKYHIDREDMAFCVIVASEDGDTFEGFHSRDEAQGFASEVAREEGSDCFILNLLSVERGCALSPEDYGVTPGVDYPATLLPEIGGHAA